MKFPQAVQGLVETKWRWRKLRHQIKRLFSLGGLDGYRAEYRERENPELCEQCGASDFVYRWIEAPEEGLVDCGRWYCFCGYAEVPE